MGEQPQNQRWGAYMPLIPFWFQKTSLRNSERDGLWSNSTVCKESNLGWLPKYKGWTTSSHSPVLWNPRLPLTTWWCNIQGPAMHHTANPETKDQAEATWLPYWVARLFMQSARDSILARHECRNHWLYPEMWRLYVTSEQPDQTTTNLPWAHIKALGESCHWHLHTWWRELSLHSRLLLWLLWSGSVTQQNRNCHHKETWRHFVTHGTRNELLSGNEPPFNSAEFENFLRSSGTEHVISSRATPKAMDE